MTPSITRHSTKSRGSPAATTLLKPLTPPQILEKQHGKFASVLAHEVRNPLTNINLAVELLKSTMSDAEQKIYLDIIMRSSIRINDLVKQLLEYQQVDEAKTNKHSIHELLDDVLEMTADRIRLKNITVTKDYTALDCKLVLNRAEMKMALTNIIINAIDAMPADKGEMKLVTKTIDGKYIMQIEDNGSGISKVNLKNIFKPYFTNKLGGMGLGLSTTLAFLRSNHARINVQSEVGIGTRFTLLFNCIDSPGDLYDKPVFSVLV